MLFLVGTGLSYDDISVGAIEACRKCNLYFEGYTSMVDNGKIDRLTGLIGKRPKALERAALEEDLGKIILEAKENDVAILTGGDPLTASTHKIAFIEARKQGVEVKVFHSSGILSAAIGESGLDFYRFGQVCTIPRWSSNYKPVSFYETISNNLSRGLHSLVLLDYFPERRGTLDLSDAVIQLEAAEAHYKKGIISAETKLFVMHNISLEGQSVSVKRLSDLRETPEGGMDSIIIPARMSKIEEETVAGMVY